MVSSRLFKVWAFRLALSRLVLARATVSPAAAPPDLGYDSSKGSAAVAPDFGYDPAEARKFAALAAMTYCGPHQITDWYCGPCVASGIDLVPGKIRIVQGGAGNSTMAVVGKFGDQRGCLVAFRGSANIENWMQDFRFRLVAGFRTLGDCDGCRIEKGFYKTWRDIHASVERALVEIGCAPGTEDGLVRLTGHSLGGALASLAMFDLDGAGYQIAQSFSFEATRVGNAAFSREFSKRFAGNASSLLFRITHYKDPVPHLPPRVLGFEHVPTEVYYDKSGQYRICRDVEDRRCAGRFRDRPLLLHIPDHCNSPVVPGGHFCGPGLSCSAPQPKHRPAIVVV